MVRQHAAHAHRERTFDIATVALGACLLALVGLAIWCWRRRRGEKRHRRLPSDSLGGLDAAEDGAFMDDEELGQVELLRRSQSEVSIRSAAITPEGTTPEAIAPEAITPAGSAPQYYEVSVDEYGAFRWWFECIEKRFQTITQP